MGQGPGHRAWGWTAGLLLLAQAATVGAVPTPEVLLVPVPAEGQVTAPMAEGFDRILRTTLSNDLPANLTLVSPEATASALAAAAQPTGCLSDACAEAVGAVGDVRFVLNAVVSNADEVFTVQLALKDRAVPAYGTAREVCELCALREVHLMLTKAVGQFRAHFEMPAPSMQVEVTLGADTDITRLATEAAEKIVERQRSEAAAAAQTEAMKAESARLLAEVQGKLNAQASSDFEAIRSFVETPSDAGRPVLEAYVQKYGEASVSIGEVKHTLPEPPQVAVVRAVLAPPAPPLSPTSAAPEPEPEPNPGKITWLRIGGGTFEMGAKSGGLDELPIHTVQVPTFELARSPVTVEQFAACVEAGACTAPHTGYGCNWQIAGRDQHPVNCVSWHQATAFAAWAQARLPSEAEWEFAARSGGRRQEYPWGNGEPTGRHAVSSSNDRDSTAPVCSKPAGHSQQGVCDLAGNVWEWIADWYGPYDQAPTDGGPRLKRTDLRVLRGGSWNDGTSALRASLREGREPDENETDLGFRLARTPPSAAPVAP